MATKEGEFQIDVEKMLKDKLGSKAKFVPRFLINWLKRILHVDELNEFLLTDGSNKVGMEWLDACVKFLDSTLVVQTNINGEIKPGLDALPSNEGGRYFTIVSNHPLGGEDGVALGSIICHKYDSQMVYLVNDLLMSLDGLAPLCVPINKTGKNSRNFPAMVEAAFTSPKNVVMFPAGLCSRKGDDGQIRDLEWKKTFVAKSIQYQRDVIPVHFSGRNSDRFYTIARWCKRLNLKVNIAMIYLVDEMMKNRGKTFTVTFGEPIPWQTFDKSKTHSEWAQWVKEKVYTL